MNVQQVAMRMAQPDSAERKEAEKMMGCKFEDMTQQQRGLAAVCLAAFDGKGDGATAETPQTRYDKANRVSYCLRLNKRTDADVIKRLEEAKDGEGMQSYIKRLIREDIDMHA